MDRQKIIISVLIVIFIFSLVASLAVAGASIYLSLNLGKQVEGLEKTIGGDKSQNNLDMNKNGTENKDIFIEDHENIPQGISGSISSIADDQIIVQQSASVKIEYKILKENIGKIVILEENPLFDEQKAKDLLEKNSDSKAVGNQIINDAALQQTVERESKWDDLKQGMKANVSTLEDGKKKISVFSEELAKNFP